MSNYQVGKNLELKPHTPKSRKQMNDNDRFVLAKYSSIGYYLVTPLILGVLLGFGLDSYFSSKPFFILFFIIIGFISAIYNLYRLVREEGKQAQHATRQHQG